MSDQLSISRLSVLARDLAGQPDEAGTVARTVVLAVGLFPGSFIDVVRLRAFGPPAVLASSDPVGGSRATHAVGDSGHRGALCLSLTCLSAPPSDEQPSSRAEWAVTHRGTEQLMLRFHRNAADGWSDAEVEMATAFADLAAVAIDRAAFRGQALSLAVGLESNRMIGTAIGILMARTVSTYDEAFIALRACSQRVNRKLRQVADEVIMTGDLPAETDCRTG